MNPMNSFKLCSICGSRAHRSATVCAICGAALGDTPEASSPNLTAARSGTPFERRYGEVDLLEGEVSRRASLIFAAVLAGGALLLTILAVPFLLTIVAFRNPTATPDLALLITPMATTTADFSAPTNTMPPPIMSTVTLRPPTATLTETPGPCRRVVQPNDDLISIIFNCGHRTLDIMPTVLELNNLSSPELIQQGQEILVPLPTAIPDPNAAAQGVSTLPANQVAFASAADNALETSPSASDAPPTIAAILPTATNELPPGVGYHIVRTDENMIGIAYQYGTNAETLSQLNPEIPFSQCDYSLDSGGPRCTVLIYVGQAFRVPLPTPTATLSPTLNGSETPTPTLTPTFNAPSLANPPHRAFFLREELITLRWVGTGILAEDEAYLIRVDDLTAGTSFTAQTRDLFFIIPEEWHSPDTVAHDYQWSIGVIRITQPDSPSFVTDTRLFTWEARTQAS